MKIKLIFLMLLLPISNVFAVMHHVNTNISTHSVVTTDKPQKEFTVPMIIAARDKAKISSPITAFVEKIPFRTGEIFKKGDILVNYDCTVMRAEKEKAEAIAQHLHAKGHNMARLYDLGGASETERNEAVSRSKESKEDLKIKSYIVTQCEIKAPFDGQVVDVYASPHEYLEQGKPVIEIVSLNNMEIKLILPSDWLSWIKVGSSFYVKLGETQKDYPAKISRLTYAIDPVSNTFTAFGDFEKVDNDVRPGMSGNAFFKGPAE